MINSNEQLNKKIKDLLLIIIFNWTIIQKNDNIMNVLNMNTNTMCQQIKRENPDVADSLIQAYVFTTLIVIKNTIMAY